MRKALVVWGGWQGHEPEQCAHIVADLLREDDFTVEVTGDLGIFGSPTLAQADLLVPIITGETLEKPHAAALVEAVRGEQGSPAITAPLPRPSRKARLSDMFPASPGWPIPAISSTSVSPSPARTIQ